MTMRVFVQPLSFFERGVVRKRSALALIKLCSILVCHDRNDTFVSWICPWNGYTGCHFQLISLNRKTSKTFNFIVSFSMHDQTSRELDYPLHSPQGDVHVPHGGSTQDKAIPRFWVCQVSMAALAAEAGVAAAGTAAVGFGLFNYNRARAQKASSRFGPNALVKCIVKFPSSRHSWLIWTLVPSLCFKSIGSSRCVQSLCYFQSFCTPCWWLRKENMLFQQFQT